MNEKDPYTQSLDVAPVNPERDFHRQTSDGGYAGGIAGSEGRGFARDAFESGGIFDNTMRQRERAADPMGTRNVKVGSRSMARTNYADMSIEPPAQVLKSGGGIYG